MGPSLPNPQVSLLSNIQKGESTLSKMAKEGAKLQEQMDMLNV